MKHGAAEAHVDMTRGAYGYKKWAVPSTAGGDWSFLYNHPNYGKRYKNCPTCGRKR